MSVALGLVVGLLAGRLSWLAMQPVLADAAFARQNHRGKDVPTGVGLTLLVAALVVEAGRLLINPRLSAARVAMLFLVFGLGALGLVDDLAGDRSQRGFRGHVTALAEGRVTTGGLKLLGGAAAAMVAVTIAQEAGTGGGLAQRLADAVLVALCANLANLFDVAPGRVIKVGAVAFAVLVAATAGAATLGPTALVVGAAVGLLLDDLHERAMLGDAGANVLGGALGLGVVMACGPTARLATLAAVAMLNGVSEWVSFSRIIDTVPPLRALDRMGRRR